MVNQSSASVGYFWRKIDRLRFFFEKKKKIPNIHIILKHLENHGMLFRILFQYSDISESVFIYLGFFILFHVINST